MPRWVLFSALLLLTGCSGPQDSADRSDNASLVANKSADGLTLELTSPKGAYAEGEAVVLRIALHHATDGPASITFPSSQHFDLTVQGEDGTEVYRWSKGRFFAQALETLELRSGQTDELEVTWDQTSGDEEVVTPGSYLVVGTSLADRGPEEVAAELIILGGD